MKWTDLSQCKDATAYAHTSRAPDPRERLQDTYKEPRALVELELHRSSLLAASSASLHTNEVTQVDKDIESYDRRRLPGVKIMGPTRTYITVDLVLRLC